MATLDVGDPAPDFTLEGTEGTFRLSEQRGRRVILLFYPGDETPVCTRQFCAYRDERDQFAELDAVVVGISAQSVDSHARFAAHHGLTVPLLADEDGAVAKRYGAHRRVGGTRRAVFIVDEKGRIGYRLLHMLGLDYQSVDELREALVQVDGGARTA